MDYLRNMPAIINGPVEVFSSKAVQASVMPYMLVDEVGGIGENSAHDLVQSVVLAQIKMVYDEYGNKAMPHAVLNSVFETFRSLQVEVDGVRIVSKYSGPFTFLETTSDGIESIRHRGATWRFSLGDN